MGFKKTLGTLLLGAGLAFGGGSKVKAEPYEFNNNLEYCTLQLQAKVDGQDAGSWGTGSINDMASSAYSIWDVDAVGMTAELDELHTQLSSPIMFTETISKQFGFGDEINIPFTLHLLNYSSDITKNQGPYAINPDLSFGITVPGGDISITTVGYVNMLEDTFNYDFTANSNWNPDGPGQFDDSGYPEQLGLSLDRFGWGGHSYYKILETTVDSHLVELYANPHHMETNNWQGTLIPEPATIGLLATGGLVGLLKRKDRKP